MPIELPQPSATYDPRRERVRNERIKKDVDGKVGREELFGHDLYGFDVSEVLFSNIMSRVSLRF